MVMDIKNGDDSTTEKATDRLELALDPDKRGGWTRLMDGDDGTSEIDDFRSVISDAREVESLREQLAEAQATLERLNDWIETLHPAQREAWKSFLSAPSSTGGN